MRAAVINIKEKFQDRIVKIDEKPTSRVYIDFKPSDIPEAVRFLFKDLGFRFATATGIDTPKGIEILYHFSQDKTGYIITLRTILQDKANPKIKSIAPIITGAEWIEREMWEMMGIDFVGHPNLKRLLLAEQWPQGKHPLRHDHEP
jgi:Ni,Fe-hydrogenase III component G